MQAAEQSYEEEDEYEEYGEQHVRSSLGLGAAYDTPQQDHTESPTQEGLRASDLVEERKGVQVDYVDDSETNLSEEEDDENNNALSNMHQITSKSQKKDSFRKFDPEIREEVPGSSKKGKKKKYSNRKYQGDLRREVGLK